MENIPSKLNLDQINPEMKKRRNSFSGNNRQNLSKSQNIFNKYNYYKKKDFLKNKRKNKKKLKNEIPDTPHNTGQYLCHIYQSNESKLKQKSQNEEGALESGINFFEDDDDDDNDNLGNFDFEFNEDTKRERLMSLEGKDLQDFLFIPEEVNEEQKIFKSAIAFDNRESLNLDSPMENSMPINEDDKK